MLIKGVSRIVLIAGSILTILVLGLKFYRVSPVNVTLRVSRHLSGKTQGLPSKSQSLLSLSSLSDTNDPFQIPPAPSTHHEIFSLSSPSRKYISLSFDAHRASNPNILPHPSLPSTWIVVAQQRRSNVPNTVWTAELTCNAILSSSNTTLECLPPGPVILPIASSGGSPGSGLQNGGSNNQMLTSPSIAETKCTGDLSHFTLNIGPHDARVFYGPHTPYVIWGSNSVKGKTCFGMWMQDLRVLIDWGFEMFDPRLGYRVATELERPAPWGSVEKNWFVFWEGTYENGMQTTGANSDSGLDTRTTEGTMWAHYDIAPNRMFARIGTDGDVLDAAGQGDQDKESRDRMFDIAKIADEKCLAQLMPVGTGVHQGTNSLAVTLCGRKEGGCAPSEDNTFVMSIFQQKRYYGFHSVYEPYVMLFYQRAPFEMFAVSQKPFWVHGRKRHPDPVVIQGRPEAEGPEAGDEWESEMFYITSVNWKEEGMKYHGFRDDVVWIGFGIEDRGAAGIDVRVDELLQDMAFCRDT